LDNSERSQKESEITNDSIVHENDGDISYLGIDLGTLTTRICTTDGDMFSEYSLIGYSKDTICERVSGDKAFFGEAALERADLEVKWPVKSLLMNDREDCGNLKILLEHCIQAAGVSARPERRYAVISVSPDANASYKRAVLEVSRQLFRGVMVANGLFCIAYGNETYDNSVIIDVGASKANICCIQGNIPEDEDHFSISFAGESIDQQLVDLLVEKYECSKVTNELARKWKEAYGFVGDAGEECKVELPLDDSFKEVIITEELKLACESIIPDIVSGIIRMVSGAQPQFRAALRNNIYICGGSSKIRNIGTLIENELSELGGGRVTLLDDPEFAGANGACRLAEKMPLEFWEKLSNCESF
jgi:rod shape-determining protein MreB